jgi:probable phosphoglycerate mutase
VTAVGVVVEADGASRGNPGPAAYGAVVRDATTGEVLAERGATIGRETNNVAEYQGLIAGLELAAEVAPGAAVEVRMDSKLVVEQMSGAWKVKHPAMRPLHARATELAPSGAVFTWVPRADNAHADRLANEALDGSPTEFVASTDGVERSAAPDRTQPGGGWMPPSRPPTTLILVRHGVTDHTAQRLFSGGLQGADPALNADGRAQVKATADWIAPLAESVDALVASPVRRTRESAEILGAVLGKPVLIEDGVAEMEFGAWDGLSYAEIQERYPDDLAAWLGNLETAPPGGESFREVEARVLGGLDRLLETHAEQTVVVVSHVTPIKTLVAHALGAPLDALYKMELSPASVTVISYFVGGQGGVQRLSNLRLFNARPTDSPL